VEDHPTRLSPLIRRIEGDLGLDSLIFPSVEEARAYIRQAGKDVDAAIINQRLVGNTSPFGALPVIMVSDGLPVEAGMLLRAEHVLDYVLDYSPHNHGHIVGLLRRAQFHGQVKVLVVDQESTIRSLFSNLLKKHGFHVLQAKTGKEAVQALAEHSEIRLVLMDMDLSGMTAQNLIHTIREKHSKQALPIIGLADEHDETAAVRFLRIGANDVITMPPRSLFEVQVRVMQNLALAEAFQEILELSRKDFLTGLFNRRHFFETAEKIHAQMRRGRINVAIAMIDIDNFKRVNDTLGHGAGDIAIVEVARILKCNLRDTDVVARFGGEEFCVLLAGLETPRDSVLVMSRIIQKIDLNIMRYEDSDFNITVSCGVCLKPMDKLEQMIQESDRLLYNAKSSGKNKVISDLG